MVGVDEEGCAACELCDSTDQAHFGSSNDWKARVVGGTCNEKSPGIFDYEAGDAENAASASPAGVITVTEG